MTREEAREAAEVMNAYAKGKNIESRIKGEDEFHLCIGNIGFNFTCYEYRIKKEPTYRPFKDKEECWAEMLKHQPFGWMKNSYCIYCFCSSVSGSGKEGGFVNINGITESFDKAYDLNTFADGTPFGIKEE